MASAVRVWCRATPRPCTALATVRQALGGGAGGWGRVEWGGLKEVERVLEKLVRSYERDPARVLDYCRQARDQFCQHLGPAV